MKTALARLAAISLVLIWIAPICNASAEVRSCGKDSGNVSVVSDFMQPIATPILRPELPHGIDPRELPQTIMLYIYVDRTGNVADVCAFSRKTGPISPTVKSLRMAAASAVLTWKNPQDFGITGGINPKVQFLRGIVSFVFTGKAVVAPHEAER
jgi:hypothetical protein